jgi:mercuric ion transport protein
MARQSETLEGAYAAEAERTGSKLAVIASLLAAVASMSCCILPLVLFAMGASGVWIGNLTALAPYQPIFIAAALGFLGYGFWRVYSLPACAEGEICVRPKSDRLLRLGLWTATIIVAAALAFPFLAPARPVSPAPT